MATANHSTMGYLCTYVPEEIIHAAGFAPVRILPDSTPATRAEAHLQSYTCSVARSCLHQALTGKLNGLSGVVFAHTCDTMQGLADIWHTAFPNLFVYTAVVPVAFNSRHAKPYLVAELRRFASHLEHAFGVTISPEALGASIRFYNERRRVLSQFASQRAAFTTLEWFETINHALTSSDPVTLPAPRETTSAQNRKTRFVVVGSTIDEPTLPRIIDELGAEVVADDLCTGSRYYDTPVSEVGDPYEALAERMLTRQPCPCKHHTLEHRIVHVLGLIKEHHADGVIFYLKKFCDPHAWDAVPLAEALDRIKIPHLLLETEQATPAGQMQVRVEAFLEMLQEG